MAASRWLAGSVGSGRSTSDDEIASAHSGRAGEPARTGERYPADRDDGASPSPCKSVRCGASGRTAVDRTALRRRGVAGGLPEKRTMITGVGPSLRRSMSSNIAQVIDKSKR